MKGVWPLLLSGAVLVLTMACQSPETATDSGRVRFSLTSADNLAPELKVWVEGPQGLFLTGARVVVTGPTGAVTLVGYSPSQGCFQKVLDGGADGSFRVGVDSLVWKAPREVSFLHRVLRTKPELTSVADGTAEAFAGESLDTARPWTLAWTAVEGAASYDVQVLQGSTVVWSQTTVEPVALVPGGTLPQGTQKIAVVAQFSAGDPLFDQADYSSVSHAASAVLTVHAP